MNARKPEYHVSMTSQEVADHLRVDLATVYRHARMLGGVKIGKVFRFQRTFIENGIWGNNNGLEGRPAKHTPQQFLQVKRAHAPPIWHMPHHD